MNKKLLFTLLIAIFIIGLLAQTAQAQSNSKYFSVGGKLSQSIDNFLSKERLANYAVVGILFIILGGLWLEKGRQSSGEDNTKYFYYVLFFILAIIVVVQTTPHDEYIWKKPFVQDTKEYLFGGDGCTLNEKGFFTKPVKLEHGYQRTINGEKVCKHPILRVGEQGRGLPVFIIVFIITLFVLKKYKEQLGLDNLDGEGLTTSKVLYYCLAFLLAATIASSGHTKDSVLRFGGWIVVLLLYGTFRERQQEGHEKSWLAMGLAFAIVETVLNLMNSGLFSSAEKQVTTGRILFNFIVGMGLGWLLCGVNRVRELRARIAPDEMAKLEQLVKTDPKRAYLRALFGWPVGDPIIDKGTDRIADQISGVPVSAREGFNQGLRGIDKKTIEKELKEAEEYEKEDKELAKVEEAVEEATRNW